MRNTSANRRRDFLREVAATGIAGGLQAFLLRKSRADESGRNAGYGPLQPTIDQSTGLPLLNLPEGFHYSSFSWTGDPLSDGTQTPEDHDGMGVVAEHNGVITLIRNHEIKKRNTTFGRSLVPYDPHGGGGCTTLTFDSKSGKWLEAKASLTGTVKNCAGGPTPWGTWLTCEETVMGPGSIDDGERLNFEKDHGWIFEVSPGAGAEPVPLKAMGRFVHEAVAVDPHTGIVYETEDRGEAGFYRFIPTTPGRLADGGRLQMLKVAGRLDLRRGLTVGQSFDATWIDIEDPERAHHENGPEAGGDGDEHGVFMQGKAQGAATFARLEGCWYGNGLIYLDSTNGGDKGVGQIWQYDPREEQLTLIFESPGAEILDSPDNLTVSPRGGLVLCEDGDVKPHRVHGLTPDGQLFLFAENNVVLAGEKNDIAGDFRAEEWAGATFSADGQWLFINVQTPGITFAIRGPWGRDLI